MKLKKAEGGMSSRPAVPLLVLVALAFLPGSAALRAGIVRCRIEDGKPTSPELPAWTQQIPPRERARLARLEAKRAAAEEAAMKAA